MTNIKLRRAGGCGRRLNGITVIELLVVLSVIALLAALIIPAVFSSRATARRLQCASNLKQFGTAMHAYEAVHRMFPPGNFKGFSLQVSLLPYLEQDALYRSIDFSALSYAPENRNVRATRLAVFLCPSDPASDFRTPADGSLGTNYAANFGSGVQRDGYNGMFRHLGIQYKPRYLAGPIRVQDVTDGLSQTAAVSEILIGDGGGARLRTNWNTPQPLTAPDELPQFADFCRSLSPLTVGNKWKRGRAWTSGAVGATVYNHVLPPNQNSCYNGDFVQEGAFTAASLHSGGVNVLFADGRLQFVSANIDSTVWSEFGSRTKSDLNPQTP